MSIPKIISYCWFGGAPLPEKVQKCIDSWKKYCPDYKIIEWNENNYNVKKIQYIQEAYQERKWAFVSDYARLDIIYETGGFYLDTDVQLVQSLDSLVDNHCFFAIEKDSKLIATGLGFGAEKHCAIIDQLKSVYESESFYKENGRLNLKACTFRVTEILENYGYLCEDIPQSVHGARILPSEYFCPMSFTDGSMCITPNTIGIHWYEASWFSKEDKHLHTVEAKLKRKLPDKIAIITGRMYRITFRFFEYLKKGILFKKMKDKMMKR